MPLKTEIRKDVRRRESLKDILKGMEKTETGKEYEGRLPEGIEKIQRVSSGLFNYTEVILSDFNEEEIKKLARRQGHSLEGKMRPANLTCSWCPHKDRCVDDGEPFDVYTIERKGKFWFSSPVADVVDSRKALRIYDIKGSIESGSELIGAYISGDEKRKYHNKFEENPEKFL